MAAEQASIRKRFTAALKGLGGAFGGASKPSAEKTYTRPPLEKNPLYIIATGAGTQAGKAAEMRAHVQNAQDGERDFDAMIVSLGDRRLDFDDAVAELPDSLDLLADSTLMRSDMVKEYKDKEPEALYPMAGELIPQIDALVERYDKLARKRQDVISQGNRLADVYGLLGAAATEDDTGKSLKDAAANLIAQGIAMTQQMRGDFDQSRKLAETRTTLAGALEMKNFTYNLAQTGMSTQRKMTAPKCARFGAKTGA